MLLRQGLTDHLSTLETDHSGPRGEIWLTIYCNKKGLTETLANNDVCTADQFEQFVMGFNQAAPLFSFVDVGIGKEAADSKIKGGCVFTFTLHNVNSDCRMPPGLHTLPADHSRVLRRSSRQWLYFYT